MTYVCPLVDCTKCSEYFVQLFEPWPWLVCMLARVGLCVTSQLSRATLTSRQRRKCRQIHEIGSRDPAARYALSHSLSHSWQYLPQCISSGISNKRQNSQEKSIENDVKVLVTRWRCNKYPPAKGQNSSISQFPVSRYWLLLKKKKRL